MSDELENQIEAILFASGKGVSIEDLSKICDVSETKIKNSVKKLKENYDSRDSGLKVDFINDKWKLTVRSKYVPHIEKLVSETELPAPVLKTLAVVAFKSPILQSEIIDMRGQGAYDHIKQLAKEGLLTKENHGRSYILKITEKFYEYFDVEGDEEIRDVFSKLKEKQQQKLGELEVIDIEERKRREDKNQSKLDVVEIENSEMKDHNNIFDDVEKKEENFEINPEKEVEKKENKKFLTDIDSQIEELSKRLDNKENDVEALEKEEDSEEEKDDEKESSEEKKEEENYL